MSASSPARVGSFPHRVRVAEAAAALVVARLLIASTPWRIWRWTLGSPLRGAANPAGPEAAELAPEIEVVRRAVDRAGRRLPLRFVCLPRAMAMHWMLRRRGIGSVLVIGVAPGDAQGQTAFVMHAWIEIGGHVAIGEDGGQAFQPCAAFAGRPGRAP